MKIYLQSQVEGLLKQIRELERNAEGPGALSDHALVRRIDLQLIKAMAAQLEEGARQLVVGLHTHASGVSPYVCALEPGEAFSESDFAQLLEETYEPHREEFLDVFFPDNIEVIQSVEGSSQSPQVSEEVAAALVEAAELYVAVDPDKPGLFLFKLQDVGSDISHDSYDAALAAGHQQAIGFVLEYHDLSASFWNELPEATKIELIRESFQTQQHDGGEHG